MVRQHVWQEEQAGEGLFGDFKEAGWLGQDLALLLSICRWQALSVRRTSACQQGRQVHCSQSGQVQSHCSACKVGTILQTSKHICALLHSDEGARLERVSTLWTAQSRVHDSPASSMHTHARVKQVPDAAPTFGWRCNDCLQLAAQGLPAGL